MYSPTDVIKESEVSVYDIRDHPDYKFRPGHSVIRVSGFEVCTLDFILYYHLPFWIFGEDDVIMHKFGCWCECDVCYRACTHASLYVCVSVMLF